MMEGLETRLTKKGQVTIPVGIRRVLGLNPRDKVRFEMEDGIVKLRRAPSKILALYGSVEPLERPEDFKKIREEFERAVADEVMSEDEE